MAIYRERDRRHNLRRIAAVALLITIVLSGAGLLVAGRFAAGSSGALPTPTAIAPAAVLRLSQSIDLLAIEYPKVVNGMAAAQTGAPGARDAARLVMKTFQNELIARDRAAFAKLETALSAIDEGLRQSHAPNRDTAFANAIDALTALQQAGP